MTEKKISKLFSTMGKTPNKDVHISNSPDARHFRESSKAAMPDWQEAQIKKAHEALLRRKAPRPKVIRHPLLIQDLR